MDLQVIIPIILLALFSLLTSLLRKLRGEREPDESKLQRKHPSRDVGADDPFEEGEIDLSDWDILFGAPQPEPEPAPSLEPPSEFRDVQGKRPVSEADTGPEFREVQGKRPVDEADTGEEFHEIRGKRAVSDESSYIEGQTPFVRASQMPRMIRPKRKRRLKLNFEPDTIRKAIIYNEIIGPPRADNDPLKNP